MKPDKISNLPQLKTNPSVFIYIALLGAIIIWILDACIDVFILNEEQSLFENIINPEPTEFWMRTLILIVFLAAGSYGRIVLKKYIQIDNYLRDQQENMEAIITRRTISLEEKTLELEKLANTDPLTNIFNRRKILSLIEYEHTRYLRSKTSYSIIIMDLDNFKSINDEFGHDTGDKTLIDFAELIKSNIRKSDQFARWGGEEFIILLPDTNIKGATTLAEHLRTIVENHSFKTIKQLTISLGLASEKASETVDQILKRADDALYDAKDNGRNRTVIAN